MTNTHSPMEFYENGHRLTFRGILIPKLVESLSIQMISTVNTLMLSSHSGETVAAVSVSTQIIAFMTAVMNMIITGSVVLTSIELGAGERKKASELSGAAFVYVVIAALIIGIVLALFPSLTIGNMNLSGNAYRDATEYFSIRSAFFFIMVAQSFFCNMLISNGFSSGSLIAGVTSNILNVTFSAIVLYSTVKLPFSKTQGVAISAVLAQAISLCIGSAVFFRKKFPLKPNFNGKVIIRILRIGAPSGMNHIFYNLSVIITTSIIASIGITAVNTKVYVTNIATFTCLISVAMGQSAAVLVGRHRGRGDIDKISLLHNRVLKYALINNTILSIFTFILRRQLLSLFTTDEKILSVASVIMFMDIFVEIIRSINNVSDQALNANGDVKITFFASTVACWIFNVIPAYILGIHFGLGLVGCWIAVIADEAFKATVYIIRWKSGKWKYTKV